MNMTRKNSRNIRNVITILLTLIALVASPALRVQADVNYVDHFVTSPFTGNPTSFTTGSAATGLSYTCSGGE